MQKDKYMNFWMLVSLVSGNMIGSGIFLLPANLASIGSISIFSWIFTAFGTILLALVFCNLSYLIPKLDGGPYTYVRIGLGSFMGFQSGLGYWLSIWIGNCATALAAVGYIGLFFPILENKIITACFAIFIIWVFTLLNMLGPRNIGWIQIVTMIGKILPLLFIIFIGVWYINPDFYLDFNLTKNSNIDAFSSGASITLWAFIGLESAAVTASKVKNPQKTIPLATLTGLLIAAFIYISSSTIIIGMIPSSELLNNNAPFALAANKIMGPYGSVVISLAAIIACLGSLNGWIMITAIVSKSIADQKLFPSMLSKENRFGSPYLSLLFSAVLMTLLLLLTCTRTLIRQFELMILMAVLAALVPYFYTTISNFLIIRKRTSNNNFFQTSTIISLLASFYSLWAIIGTGQEVIYYGIILFFSGAFIFVIAKWWINDSNNRIKYY